MNNELFSVKPELKIIVGGKWLATTPWSSPLRIGVIGTNEKDATTRFMESLKRWKEINEIYG